jgi:hypothetical protein
MDAQVTQLILIGAGTASAVRPAAELVKEFTLRIFGPAADEIGKAIASPFAAFNERRAGRAAGMIGSAARVVSTSGLEAQSVPDYLLMPLLTHGSLVDDTDLQAVWSQLLATAAVEPEAVWPAFPQILSELSGKEVRFLSSLIVGRELDWYERWGTSIALHRRAFGEAEPEDERIMIENLIRLGLIRREPPEIELHPEKLAEMLVKITKGDHVFPARLDRERFGPRYSITALGIAFVSACAGLGAVKFKPRPEPQTKRPK